MITYSSGSRAGCGERLVTRRRQEVVRRLAARRTRARGPQWLHVRPVPSREARRTDTCTVQYSTVQCSAVQYSAVPAHCSTGGRSAGSQPPVLGPAAAERPQTDTLNINNDN